MARSGPKITYIAAQYRVRVEFTRADCLTAEEPPADLLERAKEKLRAERAAGRVAFYRIFKTRLHRMWQQLRDAKVPESTKVGVTVVTGAPHLPGIEVTAGRGGSDIAHISISAEAAVVRTWRYRLFKLTVGKYLRRQGIKNILDAASLEAIWLRACRGERIDDQPLLFIDHLPTRDNDRSYQLIVSGDATEVSLVIFDVRTICDANQIVEIQTAIADAARGLSAINGAVYRTLSSQICLRLQSANRGPERYGIDLPFVNLAAIADRGAKSAAVRAQVVSRHRHPAADNMNAAASPTRTAKPAKSAKKPTLASFVAIEIAADRMTAAVKTCHAGLFQTELGKTSEEWIDHLATLGIAAKAACADNLAALVMAAKTLEGQAAARGKPPIIGQEPKLVQTIVPQSASGQAKSMRDLQQRSFVRHGELIASYQFKLAPEAGYDVTGRTLPAPLPELPPLTIGEGVEARADGTFVATFDGVPEITGTEIKLTKALIIAGNVNLASGNVYFAGPVTVKGSVESGSVVEVDGDLTVLGLIQGGNVKVSGTVTVMGGIITNGSGYVRAGGDMAANFIENSHVECGGNLTVVRGITASHVTAAGTIVVTQGDGVIAGGEMHAGKDIEVANLGRSMGPKTVVSAGRDPRLDHKLKVRRARHFRIDEYLKKQEALKEDFDGRNAAQMTKAHLAAKDAAAKRIVRAKALVDRLAADLADLKARTLPDQAAKILVKGTLSMNCALMVGGIVVSVPSDVIGVAVVAKHRSGSRLVPLSEMHEPGAKAS